MIAFLACLGTAGFRTLISGKKPNEEMVMRLRLHGMTSLRHLGPQTASSSGSATISLIKIVLRYPPASSSQKPLRAPSSSPLTLRTMTTQDTAMAVFLQ